MSNTIKPSIGSSSISSVAATATTASSSKPSSQKSVDGFARVRGPASKNVEKKTQFIVVDSPEATKLLGNRMAPGKFNPKLQQGNGWKVLELTASEAKMLEKSGVSVTPNHVIKVPKPEVVAPIAGAASSLFRDVHGISALQAKEAGWEGEGVTVTIVDTGIGEHKDLKVNQFDDIATPQPTDPARDGHGHGTHCSGSSTGRGDLEQGGIRGMAPKATLNGVKVLSDSGSGTMADVMKGVERAIEWAKAHDGPAVISMSLGGPGAKDPENDPLNKLINEAVTKHGIFFAIAAGNSGPRENTVGNPGDAKHAYTVGAYDHKGTVDDKDDSPATFTSRGRADQNKPTGSADGVNQISTMPGNKTGKMSGTSMATPVVAGGVAALLGKAHELFKAGKLKVEARELVRTGDLVKILAETAVDRPSVPPTIEGAGDLRFDKAAELMIKRFGK